MNFELLTSLLITSLITIIGWYILHQLTKKRDQDNKKKNLRINYLIDAWQKLEYASNRDITEMEFIEYIERPMASIQLFGTLKQINIAKKITDEIGEKGTTSLDSILEELRTDLRNELNLQKTTSTMKYIRFKKD